MRTKDEQKRQALIKATVKLVNEIGFASSSVAKIAKRAGVSPSTIYVFFKNKDDLLVSAYVELKLELAHALLEGFDESLPVRDLVKRAWFNIYSYVYNHLDYYDYLEQFSSSPYSSLVDRSLIEREFAPWVEVLQKGIARKVIKDVDLELVTAFVWAPILRLANPRRYRGRQLNPPELETAFGMAWDAIKL